MARGSARLDPPPPETEPAASVPGAAAGINDPKAIDIYAVRLALSYPSWVNRRVERFHFVDARMVRRQMSVDFVLPRSDELIEDQLVLVPVMILRNDVLRRLDVTDGDGRSLNVLESNQGRDVANRGLEVFRSLPLEQTDAQVRETVRAVDDELRRGVMLLVSLPYRPGVPMLVKVGYDAKLKTSLLESLRGLSRIERAFFVLSRFFSSVALMGRAERITDLPVRLGKSHHVEVTPAPGTYAEEANLVVERPTIGTDGVATTKRTKPARDPDHTRPHLWVPAAADPNRGESGSLEVILRPRREVSIFPLFFSAAVIAGVLAFVSEQARHGRVDGITLGAILLAPVALAAYYARSDENEYLTVTLRGVRWIATAAILAGVVVIALLALGSIEPRVEGHEHLRSDATALAVTRWSARVAFVSTVALGLALCAPILDEWARNLWTSHGSAWRDADPVFGLGDMALLLLPPCFLVAVGAVIVWLGLTLLPHS
jgi:hypothetical protein